MKKELIMQCFVDHNILDASPRLTAQQLQLQKFHNSLNAHGVLLETVLDLKAPLM